MYGKLVFGFLLIAFGTGGFCMDTHDGLEIKKISKERIVVPVGDLSVHNELCSVQTHDEIESFFIRFDEKTWHLKLNDSLHCDLLYCGFGKKELKGPLHSTGHARMLLGCGADPNQKVSFGERTIPLVYKLVRQLSLPALKFLCNHGATPSKKGIIRFAQEVVKPEIEYELEREATACLEDYKKIGIYFWGMKYRPRACDDCVCVVPNAKKKLRLFAEIMDYLNGLSDDFLLDKEVDF